MTIPFAIVLGALIGAGFSVLVFALLARHEGLRARLEQAATMIDAFEAERAREAERRIELEESVRRQGEVLDETRDYAGRLERLLEAATESLSEGRKAWEEVHARDALVSEREQALQTGEASLGEARRTLDEERRALERVRAKLAEWSRDDARAAWTAEVDEELEDEAERRVAAHEARVAETAAARAAELITEAMSRCDLDQGLEKAVDAVEIPDEAVKLRLIGREGRNARAFQRATGVDLVIDDTPGVVLISSFHPLRRALARRCLERLVEGGPIHPGRITELAGECRDELDAVLLENGTAAAEKAGVEDLHEDLRVLLGRLDHCRIRGQSALRHGLETAALAGSMAAELSLDAALARRAGLLLGLGRAIAHDEEASELDAGVAALTRAGEAAELIAAVRDASSFEAATPLGRVVAIAARLSARRPGARDEAFDRQAARLGAVEQVALDKPGVQAAWAAGAGRELLVLVNPDEVSARATVKLAREIAKEVDELGPHPGPIEVRVLRETETRERAGL